MKKLLHRRVKETDLHLIVMEDEAGNRLVWLAHDFSQDGPGDPADLTDSLVIATDGDKFASLVEMSSELLEIWQELRS